MVSFSALSQVSCSPISLFSIEFDSESPIAAGILPPALADLNATERRSASIREIATQSPGYLLAPEAMRYVIFNTYDLPMRFRVVLENCVGFSHHFGPHACVPIMSLRGVERRSNLCFGQLEIALSLRSSQ